MGLEIGQRKWARKAAKGFRGKWQKNFADPASAQAWAEGLAAATGLSAQQIASSTPGQNFREAQQNAAAYTEKAMRKIEAAARSNKWARNFRRAFES